MDPEKEYRKIMEIRAEIPQQSFEYKKKRLLRQTVRFNEAEPAEALMRIHEICVEARGKSLILTDLPPLRLEEWQAKQLENISKIRQYLKYEWYQLIVDCINQNLGKIPRSWYNLKETNYDVFMMSKLSSYLELVKIMLEDTLRALVTDSLVRFLDRVKEVSKEIDYNHPITWGSANLLTTLYPTPKLISEIWIFEINDYDAMKYSQMLTNFIRFSQKIWNEAINAVKDLPALTPQVMPKMTFVTRLPLNAPADTEPNFQKMLMELNKYLKRALLPVDAYVQQLYKRYSDIWNVEVFIRDGDTRRSAADVIQEVDHHMEHAKQLEKEIPIEISVSGFRIVTAVVRENLVKKKRNIYSTLLDNFSSNLKKVIQKVRDEYTEIDRKLNIRSDDPEEVIELKAYVLTIPELVTNLQGITVGVIKDYDVFDKFMVPVPDADVNAMWQAAMNGARILKMMKSAHKWLDEDYERLLYAHQAELGALSDQVDSSSMLAAGLMNYIELDRASEYLDKVSKLWKTVLELAEQCTLLNKRQKVFGYPPALEKPLAQLIQDVKPFRDFWYIAADWQKVQDTVFNGHLDEIDIDTLYKVVNSGSTNLEELLEIFAEADLILIMVQTLKFRMEEFRPNVPLIATLRSNEMRQRHWKAISDISGIAVITGQQHFSDLQEQGIQKYAKEIAQIGVNASKEFFIEYSLDKMLHDISAHKVLLRVDESSKQTVIALTQGAMEMVEKYIIQTNEIKENSFKGPFEERISIWDKKINAAKASIEFWFQNQTSWLEIEPQFRSQDIQLRLPVEYKIYEKLQRIWKRVIRIAKNNSNLIELLSDATIVTSLRQFDDLVVKIRKALEEHQKPKNSDEEDD